MGAIVIVCFAPAAVAVSAFFTLVATLEAPSPPPPPPPPPVVVVVVVVVPPLMVIDCVWLVEVFDSLL